MKKRIALIGLLAVAVAMFSLTAWAGDEHAEKGKTVTLEGEVLDMYCYMNHPDTGMGPDHAKCAKSCINKGLPIGFKSGDTVYLIIGKDHESAAPMVADFAGMKSRVTGMVVEHDGVKALELMTIEKI